MLTLISDHFSFTATIIGKCLGILGPASSLYYYFTHVLDLEIR